MVAVPGVGAIPVKTGVESFEVKVVGSRIHYLKSGKGLPVLLVHGGASDSRDWWGTMTALPGNYTFYAPDVIGYGQSERNDSGYYFSDFVESLLGLVRELRLNSCVMVGHSLGGRLCTLRLPLDILKWCGSLSWWTPLVWAGLPVSAA